MSFLGGLLILWGADLDGTRFIKGVVGTSSGWDQSSEPTEGKVVDTCDVLPWHLVWFDL